MCGGGVFERGEVRSLGTGELLVQGEKDGVGGDKELRVMLLHVCVLYDSSAIQRDRRASL